MIQEIFLIFGRKLVKFYIGEVYDNNAENKEKLLAIKKNLFLADEWFW
jgi:hypothetical protein